MIDIFEKLWRSLGRDILENFSFYVSRFEEPKYISSFSSFIRVATKILLYYVGSVFYVSLHVSLHFIRMLLLLIAINSQGSILFLIFVTSNFAEIKSTVFKKFAAHSLFNVFCWDVVERVQLLCDAFLVFLSVCSERHTMLLRAQSESGLVFSMTLWLCLAFVAEALVDSFKHLFLSKYNNIHSEVYKKYNSIMMADVIASRSPMDPRTFKVPIRTTNGEIKIQVPCHGQWPFPFIPTRRIGFITLPFLVLLLCTIFPIQGKVNVVVKVFFFVLLWATLFGFKMFISTILLGKSIKNISKHGIEVSLVNIAAQ
eukprot:GHVP01041776.1.p1 GENE.GHVP01041776.1~~GHVP01041776.1.p1  ORF type:complete len:313 (+),score=37.54 GHVP01041776.1:487-1425(+)